MFPKTELVPHLLDLSDPRWLALRRVADSEGFQRSPRLREFLLYIGRKAIENRFDEIREHTIGHQVFDRRADYNPGEDNIVRVEARQLRKRLERFYAEEGAGETMVITIPKGAYVPRFESRESIAIGPPASVPAIPEPVDAALSAEPKSPAREVQTHRLRWSLHPAVVLCLVGVSAASLIGTIFLLSHRWRAADADDTRNALWTSLFNEHSTTTIVCADSAWVLRQDILGHELKLSDYLATNWNRPPITSPNDERALQLLPHKQYTSIGDVHMVERLLRLNRNTWSNITVKSSREVQLRDFKAKNLVLLGSPRAVPWEEIFSPQLNFWVWFDFAKQTPAVQNRAPRAGEQQVYRNGLEGDGPGHDYSVVAYVDNLDHTGHVLLISGTTMQGMEAAGDYITNPDRSSALLKNLGVTPGKPLPSFEVLVNTGVMAGDPLSTKLVAYRVSKGAEQ